MASPGSFGNALLALALRAAHCVEERYHALGRDLAQHRLAHQISTTAVHGEATRFTLERLMCKHCERALRVRNGAPMDDFPKAS